MNSNETIMAVLAIAAGGILGFIVISVLYVYVSSYRLKRLLRSAKCKLGVHAPSGRYDPVTGGREIMRCLYCDEIVYEVTVTREGIMRRRVK